MDHDKLSILHDHCQGLFAHVRAYLSVRDWLFPDGNAGLRGCRICSECARQLYTAVFPSLVVAMSLAKIVNEMVQPGASALVLTANGLMALAVVVSSVLCAVMVHWGK